MSNLIKIETTEDIRIDGEIIVKMIIDEKGNKYLPYREILGILFNNKFSSIIKELKPILNEHFVTVKTKNYIPVYDLKYIFKFIEKGDIIKLNIMSQVFGVAKTKLTSIEKMEIAVKSLNGLNGLCTTLFAEIHEFDCKQVDIVHNIENEPNDKIIFELSKELRSLRQERRKSKDIYQLLNYVKSYMDNKKIDSTSLSNLNIKFSEIKKEIEISTAEKIYFNRSSTADNKAEMENKILKLKEHFNEK